MYLCAEPVPIVNVQSLDSLPWQRTAKPFAAWFQTYWTLFPHDGFPLHSPDRRSPRHFREKVPCRRRHEHRQEQHPSEWSVRRTHALPGEPVGRGH